MNSPEVGKLITGEAYRDAIHIAVAPVVAAEYLKPGDPVGFNGEGYMAAGEDPIGIVDPFLALPVNKGEKFWLFLYPGSITSLRHVWQHPAFTAKLPERK